MSFVNCQINIKHYSNVEVGIANFMKNSQIFIGNYSNMKLAASVFMCDNNLYIDNNDELTINNDCNISQLYMSIGERSELIINQKGIICCNGTNKTQWTIGKNAKIEIGCEGIFCGLAGVLYLDENTALKIGGKFSINGNYRIILNSNTSMIVGDDCMFSYDIRVRTNDGHSIFDIDTGKNISSSYDVSSTRKIVIGNHVWVGERAEILYNTKVGDGSIIGAMSLLKGKIPNNCIVAGIPARVVRKNIAWCREYGVENINECDKKYIRYTEQL